jgi:predicted PurR-regulated permease PerM
MTHQRRLYVKLLFLTSSIALPLSLILATPTLLAPLLVSLTLAAALQPSVHYLQAKGLNRQTATRMIFFCLCLFIGLLSGFGFIFQGNELSRLISSLEYRINHMEESLQVLEHFLNRFTVQPLLLEAKITPFLQKTRAELIERESTIFAISMRLVVLTPLLTYHLLAFGRQYVRSFFELIPNHFFESSYLILFRISRSIQAYLQTKCLEMASFSLLIMTCYFAFGLDYPVLNGLWSGLTHLIPLFGPFLGFLPTLFIMASNKTGDLSWAPGLTYGAALLVNQWVLVRWMSAKKNRMHPLLLVFVMLTGQRFAGWIGVLLATPLTTGISILFEELFFALYKKKPQKNI